MIDSNELTVYVKPGCPWCIGVTSHLQNLGYEFSEIDVLGNEKHFKEMEDISGQTLAPTVVYGDHVLADCGVPELKKFLKHHDIQPPVAL